MQEAAARSLRRGLERLRPLAKNKTLRYGVPMMLLIIGGSFGLREFTQIRYDAQKRHSKMDPALEERIRKNKISLESEYEIFCLRKEDNVEVNGQVLSALLLELVNSLNQKQYKNGLLSLLISCRKLKSSDFDDWKNVRGPRPWEDSKSLQEQQQQVLHSKPS